MHFYGIPVTSIQHELTVYLLASRETSNPLQKKLNMLLFFGVIACCGKKNSKGGSGGVPKKENVGFWFWLCHTQRPIDTNTNTNIKNKRVCDPLD